MLNLETVPAVLFAMAALLLLVNAAAARLAGRPGKQSLSAIAVSVLFAAMAVVSAHIAGLL